MDAYKILTLDVETTTSNKGNPFDRKNKCVMVGHKWLYGRCQTFDANEYVFNEVYSADIVVGFNIKFDLHWLVNLGMDVRKIRRVWDCQLAGFLFNSQQTPYPSLNDACLKYGFESKLDIVKTEYWDKGVDTDQIPKSILKEYLEQDILLTEKLFLKQVELFGVNI